MECDTSASDRNLAEIERLKTEIEALRHQLLHALPAGMAGQAIVLRECFLGHKRLLASHWYDHGCLECAIGHLKYETYRAYKDND